MEQFDRPGVLQHRRALLAARGAAAARHHDPRAASRGSADSVLPAAPGLRGPPGRLPTVSPRVPVPLAHCGHDLPPLQAVRLRAEDLAQLPRGPVASYRSPAT